MPRVVLGLIGTTLDAGRDPSRWESWRPSVSLCQHEDFLVDRFEILYEQGRESLAETVRADIGAVSPETEVRLHPIALRDPWDFEEVYGTLQDFARAYPFDPEREEYLLHITTGTHVCQICMFLLAEARYFPARLLQTAPPRRKGHGLGSYRVIDLDLSRYDAIARRFAREQSEGLSFLKAGIETRNAAFNRLIERIERVAISSRAPILLTGPTGAGKSRLAHKRGAFTGALQDRAGLLRSADGGILFLDEIGELGLDEQAMLLRALEEKRFLPVGSDSEAESDFQLIAGTNRSLADEVRQGRFRADLMARIDLWTFRLPGLAERREDVEPNLVYELEQISARTAASVTFNKEARQRFLAFAVSPAAKWAANFRDLSSAVTRMATLAHGGRITVEIVEEEIARLRSAWEEPADGQDEALLVSLLGPERAAELDRFDQIQLAEAIRVCRACRSLAEAGRTLFAVSRQKKKVANDADRIRKYLASHGLTWAEVCGPPVD